MLGRAGSFALLTLSDGADVAIFRTTGALGQYTPARPVAAQIAAGAPGELRYLPGLARDAAGGAPPGGPSPPAPSASAASRSRDWKFGFCRLGGGGRRGPAAALTSRRCSPPDGRRGGDDRDLHRGPSRLLAEPAGGCSRSWDFDGGGAAAGRADRRGCRRGPDRRPGRDDLPPAVHRRRHPQLLLEGSAGPGTRKGSADVGSHGIKDRVAIVGMGCTRFAEHWDKGVDELLLAATAEAFSSAGVTKQGRRRLLARHGAVGDQRHDAVPPAAAAGTSRSRRVENYCATGSEALRQAAYAVAQRGLRHGDGGRRGEGEGFRLPGASTAFRSRTTERSGR